MNKLFFDRRASTRKTFKWMNSLINAMMLISVMFVFFTVAPVLHGKFYPVLQDVVFDSIERKNGVIHISGGTLVKTMDCDWMPPWTAKADSGRMLRVEVAPEDRPNWTAGRITFGDVMIHTAAQDEHVTLYAQHRCPLYTVTTKIARIE